VSPGARQSEVNVFGPAVVAMLIYEDASVASIVESNGCIAALIRLIELDSRVEVQTSALCCLANVAVDSACRKECRRLEAARLVRPLCLKAPPVGNMALTVLDCLEEHSQLDPTAAQRKAEVEMLNSPEVLRARATLSPPSGSPSLSITSNKSTPASTAVQSKLEEELAVELPFLMQDFPHVSEETIRRTCERAGGITDAALSRLTALNQEHEVPKSVVDGPDMVVAASATGQTCLDSDPTQAQVRDEESAWATESFGAFSFMDGLQAVKPAPKTKTPSRPLHMLGSLFGGNATARDLEETFDAFDVNGDGVLSAVELKNGLLSLGVKLAPAEIDAIMNILDTDGDGEISASEFCRQFQRWSGGQLTGEEQRTMRWHTKPTDFPRKKHLGELKKEYQIRPTIDESFAEDTIDGIGQAIMAERNVRLAKAAATDRKRTRATVKQVQNIYRRSDELAHISRETQAKNRKAVEDARRGVQEFTRQEQKLQSEMQRAKDKIASLDAAATHGECVPTISLPNTTEGTHTC
jgi:hypothetical protein